MIVAFPLECDPLRTNLVEGFVRLLRPKAERYRRYHAAGIPGFHLPPHDGIACNGVASARTCRYIVAGAGYDATYCDGVVRQGSSYCQAHHARCWSG